jgi:hypothetical protein
MTYIVEVEKQGITVEVDRPGMQGPPGPPGASTSRYPHSQAVASDVWVVAHNLGYWPQVQIFSVGGREMVAEVLHVSNNVTNIYFDEPTAGVAFFD